MFNHSGDKPRGVVPSGAGYGGGGGGGGHIGLTINTSGQPYPRFGMPQNFGAPSSCPPHQDQSGRRDFDSPAMDWTSPSVQQTRFNMGHHHTSLQNDGMELDELNPAGAGVSNLIARFEGIRAVPPPPPSSSSRVMSPMSSVASPPTIASPSSVHLSSSIHNSMASMSASSAAMSRIASPVANSPVAASTSSTTATPNYFRAPESFRPPVPRNTKPVLSRAPSNIPLFSPDARYGDGASRGPSSPALPPQPQQQPIPFSQPADAFNLTTKTFSSHMDSFESVNPFGSSSKSFATQPDSFNPSTNTFNTAPKTYGSQPNSFSSPINTFSPTDTFSPPANAFSPPPAPFSPAPPTPFSPAASAFSPAPTPAPSLIPGTPNGMQTPFGPPPQTSFPGQSRRSSVVPTPKPATGSRPSREQVPAEAWESFKQTIKQLYLEERRPLKEVMQIMADQYGFQATPKMYKTRFSQWGFVKNNTEDEVKRLLSMKFQRDAEGKVSEFVRNGKVVNLGTYLKRKGVTEYDLVDFETPAQLPEYVRCRTPTPPPAPGYLRSPDLLRAQETIVGNMRKAFLHCRQFEVETDRQIGWTSIMLWGAGSSDMFADANKKFQMGEHDAGGHLLMRAFKRLEMDLKQLSPQGIKELLLGMVHRDAGMMTALCKYLAAYSTTNFERSHPLRQTFTCLYEVQQKHGPITLSELVWGCIPTIAEELEAIYGRRHPYVARTWIDLAIFYNHANQERLEKLLAELQPLRRQIEGRHGEGGADDLALRYAVVQLMQAAWPNADSTRIEALDLWAAMKGAGLVFPVRGAEHSTFCYHSPLKVDPWDRRCRDRYNVGVQFFQQHCGIKVLPYFEEDMHYTEHAPDSHSALAAALGHMTTSKFSLI
ncbi:hypothetical protein CCHL11_02453 [Colletotrichum chlorophyti]|uniref:Clr5 domain-containing protein n=1 Tax=Colletotrichum chlorophyti TaxID=708187 RepID=A0A1Q8S5X0_9PEZI|nr:hypothetical protein CCHL11_02453 [Colletotrichum chlorophyti]